MRSAWVNQGNKASTGHMFVQEVRDRLHGITVTGTDEDGKYHIDLQMRPDTMPVVIPKPGDVVRLNHRDAGTVVIGVVASIDRIRQLDILQGEAYLGASRTVIDGNLRTVGRATSGSLGVGNAIAATTPSQVIRKMEIFDILGNSLGFIAIHNQIT